MPNFPSLRSALWFWTKIVACLVCLDLLLFRSGWLLRHADKLPPWDQVARVIQRAPTDEPRAYVIGSSIVRRGMQHDTAEQELRAKHIDGSVRVLSVEGIRATGAALIGRAMLDGKLPWLVVYGVAARDFASGEGSHSDEMDLLRKSPFFDSAIDLPALPRSREESIEAVVKRYWGLYRHRELVRQLVDRRLEAIGSWLLPSPAAAASPTTPEEAARFHLGPLLAPGPRREAWKRWWQTRSVRDYLRFLSFQPGLLSLYTQPSLERLDLASSPEVSSLRWLLDTCRARGIRAVVAFFPENPIFLRGELQRYFDPRISAAVASMLADETGRHGARFVDLRNLLEPVDFIDLLHPDSSGSRRISQRILEIVAEEAQGREPEDAGNGAS